MPIQTIMQELEATHNIRTLQTLSHSGMYVYKDKRRMLNFASNDYLGLASNPLLQKEFLANLCDKDLFFSSSSSRSLSGNFEIYDELEQYLAELYKREACLLFNSGYHLNISCLQCLSLIPNVLFVVDRLAHASIFDGLRLGNKRFKRYAHNDMQELEEILSAYTAQYDYIILISEGIFSMDGDFAKLQDVCNLKKRYPNVLLYLDEAHSVGAIGLDGLGLAKSLGLVQEIDFLVLTFGKAIASIGASMLCAKKYKDFFINKARGLIYSTALPPINVAFSLFVFKQLATFTAERQRLVDLSLFFKNEAKKRNKEIIGQNQILSFMTYDNKKTLLLAKTLEQEGIFAPAIKTPTVEQGKARIRFSLSSNMSEEMILKLLDLL